MFCNKVCFSYLKLARKAKFWKPKFYQAIPDYIEPKLRDPHDYPLRTKEEITQQFQSNPVNIDFSLSIIHFVDHAKYKSDYNRKIKINASLKQMNLTPLQKERIILLLGSRLRKSLLTIRRYRKDDELQFSVDMFDTWEKNALKGQEILKELYLEAIRAP